MVPHGGARRSTRRGFLGATGCAGLVAMLSGCSQIDGNGEPDPIGEEPTATRESDRSTSSAREPPYGDEYGTVVDVVEAGADPSGEEPINDVLASTLGDDTLLYFREGLYGMDDVFALEAFTHVGIVGDGAAIRPIDGYSGYLLSFGSADGGARSTDFRCENLTFDFRGRDVGARPLQVQVADDLQIRDVAVTGRQDVGRGLVRFEVLDPDGSGTVERLYLPDGAARATRTTACLVTAANRGTLSFVDCTIQQFPDNGLYASSSRGEIRVLGGYYANNGIANVRVSGVSLVRGVHVRCNKPELGFQNMRGLRLLEGDDVRVEDCTVELVGVEGSDAAISVEATLDSVSVANTDVRIDTDGTAAILAKSPGRGGEPRIGFDNCRIVGSAATGAAVEVVDLDGITFDGLDVNQTGDDRDGIHLVRSRGTVLRDSHIAVTGEPIVRDDSTLETSNVSFQQV